VFEYKIRIILAANLKLSYSNTIFGFAENKLMS
jgi:hypothetical protein